MGGPRLRKRQRSTKALTRTVAGHPKINSFTSQEWGNQYPVSDTDYDKQICIVTAGVNGGTDIGVLRAAIIARYIALGSPDTTPLRIAVMGIEAVWSFYTASPYMLKFTQHLWRPRFDRNTSTTSMFNTYSAEASSADITIPGVTPFQMPAWTTRFKCVGSVSKILGGTRASGQHVISFSEKSRKQFNVDLISADARYSSFLTPRTCTFSTFTVTPERVFESTTGAVGTGNSFYAPISFGISLQYSAKWVPLATQTAIEIATVEAPAAKPLLSFRNLWSVNDNQGAVQQFSLFPR